MILSFICTTLKPIPSLRMDWIFQVATTRKLPMVNAIRQSLSPGSTNFQLSFSKKETIT
jgi:hypothetical protein